MVLRALLPALSPCVVTGPVDRHVRGIGHDSRQIGPDDIFVAVRGEHNDGRRFAPTLACAAVIADGPTHVAPGVTLILVPDARRALGRAAAALADHPARRLPVVGITGTNGKTTTAHLLEAAVGKPALVIGTAGHRLAGVPLPATHTTPEAPVVQPLLRRALDQGCAFAVMEVSSIGLDLHRVEGIPFKAAAFTSFSQDHLDFHGTMADYFAAKARLFTELLAPDGVAVLHGDDPAIATLRLPGRAVVRYGRGPDCDVRIHSVEADLDGCRARVTAFGEHITLSTPLVGAHNLENSLCAYILAQVLGVSGETARAGLAAAAAVPGRLERVTGPPGTPRVFVDYAHTPDALERILTALRPLTAGRIHTVFGCGGDRDRAKRPRMGRAAYDGSDLVTVTSDNPRSEDPQAIIAEVVHGLPADVVTMVDRRAAIFAAVAGAGPHDVVVIAGKGHETTQTIGREVLPFDDRQVAAAALQAKAGTADEV